MSRMTAQRLCLGSCLLMTLSPPQKIFGGHSCELDLKCVIDAICPLDTKSPEIAVQPVKIEPVVNICCLVSGNPPARRRRIFLQSLEVIWRKAQPFGPQADRIREFPGQDMP